MKTMNAGSSLLRTDFYAAKRPRRENTHNRKVCHTTPNNKAIIKKKRKERERERERERIVDPDDETQRAQLFVLSFNH